MNKKINKIVGVAISLTMVVCCLVPVNAAEREAASSKVRIGLIDEQTDTIMDEIVVDIPTNDNTVMSRSLTAQEFSQSYDTIIEVNHAENEITEVTSLPPLSRASQTSSDETVYWKANISMTWTKAGDKVCLTKVSGSCVQLRGTSTIQSRSGNYGQQYFASNNKTGSYTASSNSFTINTGYKEGSIIYGKSYLGANLNLKYKKQGSSTVTSLLVSTQKKF